MPPPPRGNPRGQQGSARGRGGAGLTPGRGPTQNAPAIAEHVETIGKRRPGYGTNGRVIPVTTNHFKCVIPESIIHHYDGNDLPNPSFTLPCSKSYFSSFPQLVCAYHIFSRVTLTRRAISDSYPPRRKNLPPSVQYGVDRQIAERTRS